MPVASIAQDRAPIITIVGDGGLGKTSLGALWPKPIFIRLEDGLQSIPMADRPPSYEVVSSERQLDDQLDEVLYGDHDYLTMVVDSISQLDVLLTESILSAESPRPVSLDAACGGYKSGWTALTERHKKFREKCRIINETRGMAIVFIGHAETIKVDPPDSESYSRYDLLVSKKAAPHYATNVDMVAFLRLDAVIVKEKRGTNKAKSRGEIVVVAYPCVSNISKNRYGITDDLPFEFGVNPFLPYIPWLRAPVASVPVREEEPVPKYYAVEPVPQYYAVDKEAQDSYTKKKFDELKVQWEPLFKAKKLTEPVLLAKLNAKGFALTPAQLFEVQSWTK